MQEGKKRSTVVRTLRVPTELVASLEAEAEKDGTTLNSISTLSLTKHVKWDRSAEKFGVVGVPRSLLVALLNSIDDGRLLQLSRASLPGILRDMSVFWAHGKSNENLLEILELWGEQGLVYNIKVTRRDEGYSVVIRHDMGRKFSLMLMSALDSLWGENSKSKYVLTHDASTVTLEVESDPVQRTAESY